MKKGTSKTSTRAVAEVAESEHLNEDDMLNDYSFLDWSKAERGKYAKRYSEGTNVVLIEPDLTDVFPNADSVNQALRALAVIIRQRLSPPEPTTTEKRKAKLSV
jgi:hypothetical protein